MAYLLDTSVVLHATQMTAFTESVVEQAALAWLESIGWRVRNGAKIAPGELPGERDDYRQVVLAQRLRDAIARLNPGLPAPALDHAFRALTQPERPTSSCVTVPCTASWWMA